MVMGSARNVLETKPPSVAAAQTRKNTMKKEMPSARRAGGLTWVSGFIVSWGGCPHPGACLSLQEPRIRQLAHVRQLLDDARFHQQFGRFLAECRVLADEEFLVGRAVLPAQVLGRAFESFAALLDVGAHDLEALLRLFLDHFHGLEIAVGQRLRCLGVVAEEL